MQNQLRSNQAALGNIQLQDEANRQKWLQLMPGMDLQAAQYGTNIQDKNISRALTELNAGRAMQQGQFNEAMRAWAADKTADAMKNQGSTGLFNDSIPILGGCFLTTACVDAMGMPDDCWVLESARKFRDTFMTETPEKAYEIQEYYMLAPKIVKNINEKENANKIWKNLFWSYIIPFVQEINSNNLQKAHQLYKLLIKRAKNSPVFQLNKGVSMDPLTIGLIIGGSTGLLKGLGNEQKMKEQQKYREAAIRYSPWTGMSDPGALNLPGGLESALSGGLTGAMVGNMFGGAGAAPVEGAGAQSASLGAGTQSFQNTLCLNNLSGDL